MLTYVKIPSISRPTTLCITHPPSTATLNKRYLYMDTTLNNRAFQIRQIHVQATHISRDKTLTQRVGSHVNQVARKILPVQRATKAPVHQYQSKEMLYDIRRMCLVIPIKLAC